jgi:hypothetical protein
MNDPVYNRMRELSWRQKLTDAEEVEVRAWLEAHPDSQVDWEAEAGLNQALARLPDAPVASNFTARVLQTVARETTAEARRGRVKQRGWQSRLAWLPKAAVALIILGAGLFSYHSVVAARRSGLAHSVTAVSNVASLPSPEILQDFEAIRALNRAPPADEQLLALLQ